MRISLTQLISDRLFHPGFKLMLKTPLKVHTETGLTRFEDFTTGEAVVRWSEGYKCF